jgi:hypothetical protein
VRLVQDGRLRCKAGEQAAVLRELLAQADIPVEPVDL